MCSVFKWKILELDAVGIYDTHIFPMFHDIVRIDTLSYCQNPFIGSLICRVMAVMIEKTT